MNRHLSRRKFLGEAACAAVTAAPLISTLLNLSMTNTLAASSLPSSTTSDYKALVCILLAGGNDSFNMLVPRATANTVSTSAYVPIWRWRKTACSP